MWYIIGLILFFITLYVHKHTYIVDSWDNTIKKKVSTPLWLVILGFIVSLIPILNIVAFVVGVVTYTLIYTREVKFKPTGVVENILNFLKKEV